MDEEIERLIVSVRADTTAFTQDVRVMREELDGPLADGLGRAGQRLEGALLRAIQRGKFGFEDLRNLALSVLNDIASAAIRTGLDSIFGGGAGAGGVISGIGSVLGGLLGAPGRATGGPVSPGRAFLVGERGPEIFVPTSSGRVETGLAAGSQRPINLTVNISDNGRTSAPELLQRSSRQLVRQMRRALDNAQG